MKKLLMCSLFTLLAGCNTMTIQKGTTFSGLDSKLLEPCPPLRTIQSNTIAVKDLTDVELKQLSRQYDQCNIDKNTIATYILELQKRGY